MTIRLGDQRLTVGADFYNLTNSNVTLGFNPTFVVGSTNWPGTTGYMNPRVMRLNAEFSW